MDAKEMLNQLEELYAHKALIDMDYSEKRNTILLAVREPLMELEAELAPIQEEISGKIAELEAEIKTAVLAGGETVKGTQFMAVYVKGREGGWDGNKLKGFAMAHPEIMAAKKPDGEPSVSIRKA